MAFKRKITAEGQPCRHCGSPVTLKVKKDPALTPIT
jgi:hypothetical protein